MLHVVNIHTPDPEIVCAKSAEGRIQGGYGSLAYESSGK
ncbi:DUF5431 family protein (plasmid) [Escherichia coli]|nr:DUF5431 family protein [Escherichia coli]